ncbi:hypothetical protein TNCV_4251491 [Trichonephila clavipes]|nr:hypothetical protein TNCV_4251491 [Trichonephila clavipes]
MTKWIPGIALQQFQVKKTRPSSYGVLPSPAELGYGINRCRIFLHFLKNGATDYDLEMANLPTDMELEQAESQRNATRTPSPQLTPCEQLKYSKA